MASIPDDSASISPAPDDAVIYCGCSCSACKRLSEMDDDAIMTSISWHLERNKQLYDDFANGLLDQDSMTMQDYFAVNMELERREAEAASRIRLEVLQRKVEDVILNWDLMPSRPRGSA